MPTLFENMYNYFGGQPGETVWSAADRFFKDPPKTKWNDIEGKPSVVDGLASSSVTDMLSANQGRVLKGIADNAEAIAKGKNRARVFADVPTLDNWLAVPVNAAGLLIGDNFYIIQRDVPDYWWDGTQRQELETQKVDLADYPKTAEVQDIITAELTKNIGNGTNISIGEGAGSANSGIALGKDAYADAGVAIGAGSAVPAGFGNGAAFGINSEVMRYGQQVHNITGEPNGKLHHSFVYYTGTTNNTNTAINSKEIFLHGVEGKRFTVPLDRNFAFSMVMQMLAFNLDRSNSDMIWKIYNVSATVYNGALQVFSNSSNLLSQSTFLTTANTGLEIKADASNSSIKIGAYGGTADQPLTWLVKGDVIEFRGDKRGG